MNNLSFIMHYIVLTYLNLNQVVVRYVAVGLQQG